MVVSFFLMPLLLASRTGHLHAYQLRGTFLLGVDVDARRSPRPEVPCVERPIG